MAFAGLPSGGTSPRPLVRVSSEPPAPGRCQLSSFRVEAALKFPERCLQESASRARPRGSTAPSSASARGQGLAAGISSDRAHQPASANSGSPCWAGRFHDADEDSRRRRTALFTAPRRNPITHDDAEARGRTARSLRRNGYQPHSPFGSWTLSRSASADLESSSPHSLSAAQTRALRWSRRACKSVTGATEFVQHVAGSEDLMPAATKSHTAGGKPCSAQLTRENNMRYLPRHQRCNLETELSPLPLGVSHSRSTSALRAAQHATPSGPQCIGAPPPRVNGARFSAPASDANGAAEVSGFSPGARAADAGVSLLVTKVANAGVCSPVAHAADTGVCPTPSSAACRRSKAGAPPPPVAGISSTLQMSPVIPAAESVSDASPWHRHCLGPSRTPLGTPRHLQRSMEKAMRGSPVLA